MGNTIRDNGAYTHEKPIHKYPRNKVNNTKSERRKGREQIQKELDISDNTLKVPDFGDDISPY